MTKESNSYDQKISNYTNLYIDLFPNPQKNTNHQYKELSGYGNMLGTELFLLRSSVDKTKFWIRNFKNDKQILFPFKEGTYEILAVEQNKYMLLKTIKNEKLFVVNLTNGESKPINTNLHGPSNYLFYTAPNEKTVKLIIYSTTNISIMTLLDNNIKFTGKNSFPIEEIIEARGQEFTNVRLTRKKSMLLVTLRNANIMLLFLDGYKNRFPYLANKIYPYLSLTEQRRFGLGEK
jgi:hypothetical protein